MKGPAAQTGAAATRQPMNVPARDQYRCATVILPAPPCPSFSQKRRGTRHSGHRTPARANARRSAVPAQELYSAQLASADRKVAAGYHTSMDRTTLAALAQFPDLMEAHYAAIPRGFSHWAPASWEGIPSEPFTPIEQLCHVRDIEIDGYHVRLRRALREERPVLAAIDGAALARERGYATADAARVCSSFRVARG